jgi:hypothetical protein
MTSSTNGKPVLVSGERRDKQRSEAEARKARADREATKQAVASAQMYRAMFPDLWKD